MFHTLFHSEAAAPTQSNLAAIILRLGLAITFLMHGMDKIVFYDGGADWVNRMYGRMPETGSQKPEPERIPTQIPTSLTWTGVQLAVAWGEFLGGLALAVGMLTRLAALGEIIIQLGAIVLITAPRGFQLHGGEFEYQLNLALIVMCVAVIILGPGHWSIDRELSLRRTRKRPAATVNVLTPSPLSGLPASVPAEQLTPGASS